MSKAGVASGTADGSAEQIAIGLGKLALVFRQQAWADSGEHGLNPTQAQIVSLIGGVAGGIGVNAVADQLGLTAGTVSASISTLVGKDLLRKERGVHDGRSVVLKLTAKGRRAASTVSAWPDVVARSLAELPETERRALLRGLIGLISQLQERGAVPTTRMCVECRFFRPNTVPGSEKPHRCEYLQAQIADRELRIDCNEMEPAVPGARMWQLLIEGQSRA